MHQIFNKVPHYGVSSDNDRQEADQDEEDVARQIDGVSRRRHVVHEVGVLLVCPPEQLEEPPPPRRQMRGVRERGLVHGGGRRDRRDSSPRGGGGLMAPPGLFGRSELYRPAADARCSVVLCKRKKNTIIKKNGEQGAIKDYQNFEFVFFFPEDEKMAADGNVTAVQETEAGGVL